MSAQAKPISEVVKDFEQSLENLRPSTRRIYVAGAKTAIRCAHLELWQCPSTGELLASLGESPTEKKARVSPFLNFLGGGELKELVSDEDSTALQNWVIQTLAKEMRSVKNPSIATRRDLGLIAALCAAPSKGTPRKWPENCLKIDDREVLLWDTAIEEPCFAISLRFWQAWRERTAYGERPVANPAHGAIGPNDAVLELIRSVRVRLDGRENSWAIIGMNGVEEGMRSLHQALAGTPPNRFVSRAYVKHLSFGRIGHPEDFADVLS